MRWMIKLMTLKAKEKLRHSAAHQREIFLSWQLCFVAPEAMEHGSLKQKNMHRLLIGLKH